MQLIAWSIPVFVALMLLEAWLARRRGLRLYRLPVAVSDLSCGITSQLFNLATFGVSLAIYAWVYQARLFEMDAGSARVWLFALLAVDLCTTSGTAPATRSTSFGRRTSCITTARTITSRSRCGRRC